MIIIEFYDGQGLGNQLWVYVSMRNIAKKIDSPFIVLSAEKFKAKDFLDIDYGELHKESDILKKIKNDEINIFNEKMYLDMDLNCFMTDYDKGVLDIGPYTKIEGYFQSEKYFFNDDSYYKKLLPFKSNFSMKSLIDKDTCVLNIRGGEYKTNINLILPKSYWLNSMRYVTEKFNISKFAIVTDDSEYCKKLFPDIEIIESGIAESYMALYQASVLILSNSSFSYFPVKMQKDLPFVIAPKYWWRFDNKFKRWSSPANFYKDWNWLDGKGKVSTYQECLEGYIENVNYYESSYNVRVKNDIKSSFRLFPIKKYIPTILKNFIKKIMPYRLAREVARIIK